MSLDQNTIETLRALQHQIGQANAEKGFHDEGNRLRELCETADLWMLPGELTNEQLNYYTARLALITTEVAEAIEELRNGHTIDETYYSGGLGYASGDPLEGYDRDATDQAGNPRKPEGVPSELADVVIRAFDFADEAGIDLAAIVDEKLAYNATRAKMHGRKF